MIKSFKYFISIFCCFTSAASLTAQPTSESQRGAYSVEQVRQARETAEMNRHYESIKPSSNNSNGNTGNTSSNPVYFSFKTRKEYIKEQNEKIAKEKAGIAEYNKAEAKFIQLVRERSDLTYLGDEENYNQYVAIAKQAGFSQMQIFNSLGTNAVQFVLFSNKPNSLLSKCYTSALLYNENKSTYEKSVSFSEYMKSQKSAQDFNDYLKLQNSNQGFNTFKEKPVTLQPLPVKNNNATILQGLQMKNQPVKSTEVLDALRLDTARNSGKPVLRELKFNTSETKISDSLRITLPKDKKSETKILDSLKLKTTDNKNDGQSILNSLKLKETP